MSSKELLYNTLLEYEQIFIDLDGTMIYEELYYEYIKKHPLISIGLFPLWLFKKLLLKQLLSYYIHNYTIRVWLVDLLRSLPHKPKVILITGTNMFLALRIAKQLDCVQHVIGSTLTYDCIGANKIKQMPEDAFYIGNSKQDLLIWKHYQKGCIISVNKKLIKKAKEICSNIITIED